MNKMQIIGGKNTLVKTLQSNTYLEYAPHITVGNVTKIEESSLLAIFNNMSTPEKQSFIVTMVKDSLCRVEGYAVSHVKDSWLGIEKGDLIKYAKKQENKLIEQK